MSSLHVRGAALLVSAVLCAATPSAAAAERGCPDTGVVGAGAVWGLGIGVAAMATVWLVANGGPSPAEDTPDLVLPGLLLGGGVTFALAGVQVGTLIYGLDERARDCPTASAGLRIAVGLSAALLASGVTTLTALAASDGVGITVGAVLGPALVALDNRALDGRGSIEFSLLAGAAGAGVGLLAYGAARPGEAGWDEVTTALVPFTASLFTLVVHELTHDPGAEDKLRVDASAISGGVFFSARGAL